MFFSIVFILSYDEKCDLFLIAFWYDYLLYKEFCDYPTLMFFLLYLWFFFRYECSVYLTLWQKIFLCYNPDLLYSVLSNVTELLLT